MTISDGFTINDSPYYYDANFANGTKTIQLPYYSGTYKGQIMLYKLHGSKDYYWSLAPVGNHHYVDEVVVKSIYRLGELKKQVDGLFVERYQPTEALFLTGTTHKIAQYETPFFEGLFPKFSDELKESDVLIIIGYGFKDERINQFLVENSNESMRIIVLDKFFNQSPAIQKFICDNKQLNIRTKWVEMSNLTFQDLI